MKPHFKLVTPEEREKIVVALQSGPRDASHRRAVGEQFGRSRATIDKIDRTLAGAPPVRSIANLEGFIPEPPRINKVIDFCRSYGKGFSLKMAQANVSLDAQALNLCLSRLVHKGMLTRVKLPLTKQHQGRTPVKIMAWVYYPTELLLEGDV